jgi:peptide/nickel transport system permease protein
MSYADPSIVAEINPRARRRRLLRKRFLRRPFAVVGLVVAVGFIVSGIFAPWIAPYPADTSDFTNLLADPSRAHLLGTDELGRDVFSRLVWGSRASIQAGVFATLLAALFAVPIGMVAGYYRGWIDSVLSRIMDIQLAFPVLLLAIGLGAACSIKGCFGGILQPGLPVVVFVISLAQWPYMARIIRGQTLSLREKEFVEAARSLGASNRRIIFRELLPNLVAPIIVYSTILVPTNILFEAALSFLGVGVQPPTPSWGAMISEATSIFDIAWWFMLFPGLALLLTVLAFNLVGDGLQDALNPRRK